MKEFPCGIRMIFSSLKMRRERERKREANQTIKLYNGVNDQSEGILFYFLFLGNVDRSDHPI